MIIICKKEEAFQIIRNCTENIRSCVGCEACALSDFCFTTEPNEDIGAYIEIKEK